MELHALTHALTGVVFDAGRIVRSANRRLANGYGIDVSYKDDDTPVTETDHQINELMKQFAHEHNLGYVGEEGNGILDRDLVLYVDPIDGTDAFTRGMNTATIIASVMRMHEGRGYPELGIMHEPTSERLWIGQSRYPTRYEHAYGMGQRELSPLPVSTPKKIKTAICVFPGASHNLNLVSEKVIADNRFSDQQMGGFGIGAGLIAIGLIHATAIASTAAVEVAAMSLIVNGVGGVSYDLSGNPLTSFEFGEIRGKADFLLPNGALFACSKPVAEAVLEKVRDANTSH